jgi:hypothetical protein
MKHYGYFGEEQTSTAPNGTIASSAPNGAANEAAPLELTPEQIKMIHKDIDEQAATVQLMPPQDIDDETYDYCVQTANAVIEFGKNFDPTWGPIMASYFEGIPFERKLQAMISMTEGSQSAQIGILEQQLGKTKEEILNCLHAASFKKMDVVDYPLKDKNGGITSMIAKHPVLSVGVALGLGYLVAKKM